MEERIAELQAQITELKELVGVPEQKQKRKKIERQWEGMRETETKTEPAPAPAPEPEKNMIARIEALESDVKTIKEQVAIIFRELEKLNVEMLNQKRHHFFQ